MNRDEMLQRFYNVSGKAAYETDKIVFDHASACLIFRETEWRVRNSRVVEAQTAVVGVWSEFFFIWFLGYVPVLYLVLLLILFTAIGFWGIRWVAKQRVFEEQKEVCFEIDTERQTIRLPVISKQDKYKQHTEIPIDQIRNFYAQKNDGSCSLGCTYGKHEKEVILKSSGFHEYDEISYYARLMGFVCDKEVLERKWNGKLCPIKKDKAFP